jgi:predicted nuclease of restriction endonuclease-like RecB superfamily
MLIRHQDIPRTSRTGKDGIRRLYPRFIKDGGITPPVGHVIGYLDAMTGRRRSELEPDAILSLVPDPRQARSLLTVLGHDYRYRHETIADLVGEPVALTLAGQHGLTTPAEVRAWIYRRLNDDGRRFVTNGERAAYLEQAAAELGIDGPVLDSILSIDAERNARLTRIGPRPDVASVFSRYNIALALSVLRTASEVRLSGPDVVSEASRAFAERHGVAVTTDGEELVLRGRRDAFGSLARHGARLARVAYMLLARAGKRATLTATVHLGDRSLLWEPDGPTRALFLPARRSVSLNSHIPTERILAAIDERRRFGDGFDGWTVRRAPLPVAADNALIAPQLLFVRDGVRVPLVIIEGRPDTNEQAAIDVVGETQPLLVHIPESAGEDDAFDQLAIDELLAALDDQVTRWAAPVTPVALVAKELDARSWVPEPRIDQLTMPDDDPARWLHPLLMQRGARWIPGAGLIDGPIWYEWTLQLSRGPVDLSAIKQAVMRLLGPGAPANAVTLALLDEAATLTVGGLAEAA